VTGEYVEKRLGLVGEDFLSDLERSIRNADSTAIFSRTEELRLRSTDPMKFSEEFLAHLRERIVTEGVRSGDFPFLSNLFETLSEAYPRMRQAPDPMIVLEAALARVAYSVTERVDEKPRTPDILKSAPAILPTTPSAIPQASPKKPIEPLNEEKPKISVETSVSDTAISDTTIVESTESDKPVPVVSIVELVQLLKATPRSAALTMAIKNARCFFADAETFVIVCGNSLSEGQISKPESRALILESLEKLTGSHLKLKIESQR
jgi:DNA polymerase III gamma/tau subunit